MNKEDKAKLSKDEKMVIAAMSALAAQDPKVLAMGILVAIHKSMPDESKAGKSEEFVKAQCCLAAMGMIQTLMDQMRKHAAKREKAKAETAEKPDSAFSDEDKARAQEILTAFMERSGVHLKQGEGGSSK